MKFRAHDTFFIRKGWLSKGMKHIEAKPDVFISKENNPMDILGIGSNARFKIQLVKIYFGEHGLLVHPGEQATLEGTLRNGGRP